MTRNEIIEKLREADVAFDKRLGRDKLYDMAVNHGIISEDNAPPGGVYGGDEVVVECLWSNVWTSRGKLLRGETMSVPADEYEALFEKRAVMKAPEAET